MTSCTACKTLGSEWSFFSEGILTPLEFIGHSRFKAKAELLIGRQAVTPEGRLWERGQFSGDILRSPARCASWHHAIDQSYRERLVRTHRPAGQYEIKSAAEADYPRQPYCASINQRHSPAPIENAEDRVLFHDSHVTE